MAEDRAPLSSVEAVREELRRLGYLDHGLDRFVLSGAGGPSPLRASLRAATRIGLAGGLLFGFVSALAAVGFDRRLLAEPRDLAVLTLFLVVATGAVTAVASALGGLAAAWLGRRTGRRPGPGLARNVGLVVALLGLLYLALWWRTHLASAALPARAGALLLGLGLSLALGRFASLAAVAVLAAGGLGDGLPRAGLGRRQLLVLLAGAIVFYTGAVGVAAYLGRSEEAPDFAVIPTGLRIRVLGVDGLERRMTEQMTARGEMPRLKALLDRGAQGRLRAEPERVPAIVWTTIATGRGPEAHGIQATSARRVAGLRTPLAFGTSEGPIAGALARATDVLRLTRSEPATSVLRGVKAFWNVASQKGLRVGVVNWWATWPADPVNGYLVSDRTAFKLEKGALPDRDVQPPELFGRLAPPEASDNRARALDLFAASAAKVLRGANPPDVEAVYLPGLDIFTMQQLGEASAADLASLEGRLGAVREYYRFLDRLIGEATADLGPEDVIVLVGDPGRLARSGPGRAEGTLAVVGGPARATDLGEVSERDVAPTVLHLLGLPVSREFEGRVLEAALEPAFTKAHAVRTVAAFGRRPPTRHAESAFDRDMLEELKSLGYIQ
jgi:Type I phosphodiesterase / nucleotide pyrophosphatase